MTRKKTISFTPDEFGYDEILRYARIKGHGGQHPASTFAHYAAFQMMKKYPLSEAEIERYEETHGKGGLNAKAVQPDAPGGVFEWG